MQTKEKMKEFLRVEQVNIVKNGVYIIKMMKK